MLHLLVFIYKADESGSPWKKNQQIVLDCFKEHEFKLEGRYDKHFVCRMFINRTPFNQIAVKQKPAGLEFHIHLYITLVYPKIWLNRRTFSEPAISDNWVPLYLYLVLPLLFYYSNEK